MSDLIITVPIDGLKAVIAETIKNEMQKYLAQSDHPETELITRDVAAKLLGISLKTLHEWTKTGIIPAYRISTRVRYKKSEIVESISKIKTTKHRRGVL